MNASTLVADLSAAMLFRDSQKPLSSSRCEPGFLLDIGSLFLSRVVQMHSQKDSEGAAVPGQSPGTPSASACSTLFLSLSQPEGSLNNEKSKPLDDDNSSRRICGPGSAAAYNLAEAAWEDESDKDSDAGAQEADVIDPLAYRIPCPRSSGGTAKYG